MSSKQTVKVVVSCTKSKRLIADPDRCLSNQERLCLQEALSNWKNALGKSLIKLPAKRLYKGVSWSYVLAAHDIKPEFEFYVASAGCGLVPFHHELPGYQASFSMGPDQVSYATTDCGTILQKNQRWWEALADFGLGSRFDSTLFCGPTIVCCGAPYIAAMGRSLQNLARELGPNQLLLICSGASDMHPELEECLLSASHLRGYFNVTHAALNARILKWIVEPEMKDASFMEIRKEVTKLQEYSCKVLRKGAKMCDLDIVEWIRIQLEFGPNLSATVLLRKLRSNGLACEQKRFATLVTAARRLMEAS